MPRLSMPSSLVTRIRGRLVQSPSGRPRRLSERRAPRGPATGSPRSLSRSRRSDRARSLVISGCWPPASGFVALGAHRSPSAAAPRSGAGAGSRRRGGLRRRDGGRCRRRRHGSARDLVDVRVDARDRLAWPPDVAALALGQAFGRPVGHGPVLARPAEPVEEEHRQDGRDRDAEDGAGDARDLAADDDRGEDHDRVDADRARHHPRGDDVHRHEPRDAHHDQHRQDGARVEQERDGDRRQPGHERAEERDRVEQARGHGRQRGVLEPEHDVHDRREHAEHDAHHELAAQEPAERLRDARLEQARLGHEAGRAPAGTGTRRSPPGRWRCRSTGSRAAARCRTRRCSRTRATGAARRAGAPTSGGSPR